MTTISEHVYTARVLDPGGDIVLSIDEDAGGDVTLDASAIPHVQASLTLAVEDAMLLEQLDPRESRRVVLDVDATFPTVSRSRSFDLGIREATPDRAAGTVTLRLASDEALLMDFAQLVDDVTPRTHEASLRDVVDYVLGKIGAALEPGDEDADVTAYWRLSNLLPNPSFEVNLTGWTAGAGSTGLVRNAGATPVAGAWAALWKSTGAVSSWLDGPRFSATPGRPLTFSGYMIADAARPARIRPAFVDATGTVVLQDVQPPTTVLATGAWTRLSVTAVPPPGAAYGVFRLEYQANAANRNIWADCCMVTEGAELVPYIDGAVPDTAVYDYSWSGDAHASTSTRTPSVERSPESLVWRAGVSAMSFLEPLLKAAGLRLVCDEQRRWTLRDAEYRADGNQTYRHAVNIETADESLSREDDAWRDAAVYEYIWNDADGIEQRRLDAFSLTGSPTKVAHVEVRDTPFPGPGRAEHMVRRAQGQGRTVSVSAIPTWLEHTDQTLSILLEGTPIQTGIAASVTYDLAADTVTVTSRTTDTPAAAWILIPVGERWIDSPPGGSWIGEVI